MTIRLDQTALALLQSYARRRMMIQLGRPVKVRMEIYRNALGQYQADYYDMADLGLSGLTPVFSEEF